MNWVVSVILSYSNLGGGNVPYDDFCAKLSCVVKQKYKIHLTFSKPDEVRRHFWLVVPIRYLVTKIFNEFSKNRPSFRCAERRHIKTCKGSFERRKEDEMVQNTGSVYRLKAKLLQEPLNAAISETLSTTFFSLEIGVGGNVCC